MSGEKNLNEEKQIKSASLQATSYSSKLILGELEHPNKLPFSGILTFFDVPSDNPPGGADGLKVLIPSDVGIPALESLVGMAINYVPGKMDGHNPQEKIGIITDYSIGDKQNDGSVPIYINGYIFALDFEDAAISIKTNQSTLGFSYETAKTLLTVGEFNGEKVAVVESLVFTGASVLYKDTAAYSHTSLAASKFEEGNEMDLQNVLDAIAQLKEYIDTKFENAKKEDELEDALDEKLENAGESNEENSEVEDESSESEVSDEGSQESNEGEVEAETEENEKNDESNDESKQDDEKDDEKDEDKKDETQVAASIDVKTLMDKITSLETELTELKANAEIQASARKSIAHPVTLMAKYDIKPEDDQAKLMASIESREDLSIEERMALKFEVLSKKNK